MTIHQPGSKQLSRLYKHTDRRFSTFMCVKSSRGGFLICPVMHWKVIFLTLLSKKALIYIIVWIGVFPPWNKKKKKKKRLQLSCFYYINRLLAHFLLTMLGLFFLLDTFVNTFVSYQLKWVAILFQKSGIALCKLSK